MTHDRIVIGLDRSASAHHALAWRREKRGAATPHFWLLPPGRPWTGSAPGTTVNSPSSGWGCIRCSATPSRRRPRGWPALLRSLGRSCSPTRSPRCATRRASPTWSYSVATPRAACDRDRSPPRSPPGWRDTVALVNPRRSWSYPRAAACRCTGAPARRPSTPTPPSLRPPERRTSAQVRHRPPADTTRPTLELPDRSSHGPPGRPAEAFTDRRCRPSAVRDARGVPAAPVSRHAAACRAGAGTPRR